MNVDPKGVSLVPNDHSLATLLLNPNQSKIKKKNFKNFKFLFIKNFKQNVVIAYLNKMLYLNEFFILIEFTKN